MIKGVSIVLAHWCPHCVPLSLNNAGKIAKMLGVPLRVLDIDLPERLKEADNLVRSCGDWCEDYLIPQVFVEYDGGEVKHVFTGFSEAVSVTGAGWNSLFSFIERHEEFEVEKAEEGSRRKSLIGFVDKYLTFKGQCRRHCDEPASLVKLSSGRDRLVGAYVCPRGFASRVVHFGEEADIKGFKLFLESQLGKGVVKRRDLRVATRYGWELERGALSEIGDVFPDGVVKEVYWTVYPKTEAEKRLSVFLCQEYEGKKGVEDSSFRKSIQRTDFVQDADDSFAGKLLLDIADKSSRPQKKTMPHP